MNQIESLKEYRNYQNIVRRHRCWLYIFFFALDRDLKAKCFERRSKEQYGNREYVLNKIAKWALKYSPIVSTDPPDGLIIDITGTERLFGTPEYLSKRIYRSILKNGFSTTIATAPTIGCAWGLARFIKSPIRLDGNDLNNNKYDHSDNKYYPIINAKSENYLDIFSRMPIQALRLGTKLCDNLHELGIRLIKDLLAIPRAAISQRFGTVVLKQLDLALGAQEELITPLGLEQQWQVIKRFDNPVYHIPIISHVITKAVGELCSKLRSVHKTATIFNLEIIGNSNQEQTYFSIKKEFKLVSATDDPRLITLLTTPFLETLSLPGPICKIILEALDVQNQCEKQISIEGNNQAQYDLNELINRLIGQLGQDKIRHIKMRQSYLPEKSFSFDIIKSLPEMNNISPKKDGDYYPYIPSNRPPILLKTPQAISVIALLPDAIPAQIQIAKTSCKIIEGIGPEKITTEWWDIDNDSGHHYIEMPGELHPNNVYAHDYGTREYFKVQDEFGRWLWIFRIEDSMKWFLHGLWP